MDKKRRRSLGTALKNSNNILVLSENDDEQEKKERRKSKLSNVLSRKSMAGSFSDGEVEEENSTPKNPLSNEQLSDLYAICLRLCSENKINTKNTWSLNLIDYMDDVLDVQKDDHKARGPGTNFQAASATLDASIKIYSCRVDSVYSEAYKVIGGLASDENDENTQKEDENVDSENIDETIETKKKTTKRSGGINTITTNDSEITLKKFDLEFSVDPLFQKTSAAFDEGGAKGLLLNHLSVHKGCEILFDSAETINEGEDERPMQTFELLDLGELNDKMNITSLEKLEICPVYVNWTFSDRPEEDLGQVELDETFVQDIPDEFETNDEEGDLDHQFVQFNEVQDEPENFEVLQNMLSTDLNVNQDYSFFDVNRLDEVGGGEHWKFKGDQQPKNAKIKKKVEYDEDGNIIEPKRKPRKKQIAIDFFGELPEGFEKLFEPAGRSSTTLTKAALSKQENQSSSLLLPDDDEFDESRFNTLFLNQTMTPQKHIERQEFGDDDNTNWINNYGHESNEEDRIDVMGALDFDLEGEEVAKPKHQAEVLKVNYAKVDKKVDVKALKQNVWFELCNSTDGDAEEMKEEKSFQSVLEKLPEKLHRNVVNEISVPYCFVCLLHLANEKNLTLTQETLDDIFITQVSN